MRGGVMVTYRSSIPKLQVRLLALHPFIVFLLIVSVFASEPASDVDESSYYDYATALAEIEPRSAIYSIPRIFSGVFGGTSLFSSWASGQNNTQGTVRIGDYSFDVNSTSLLQVLRAAMLMTVNVVDYVDSADSSIMAQLQSLEDNVVMQSDLTPIQSLLTTYLPRIDTNTQSLHGDLLNIQSALGTDYASTGSVLSNLLSIKGYLYQLSGSFDAFLGIYADFRDKVEAGFSDVTTRQDSFAQFWSTGKGFSFYNDSSSNLGQSTGTFPAFLTQLDRHVLLSGIASGSYNILSSDGSAVFRTGNMYLPFIALNGFLGLSSNLAGSDKTASITAWQGPDQTQQLSATNVLDMLGLIGTQLQNPLAKISYVWADDDDIRIADKNQPVKDQIEEDFVGGGQGAVSVSDISGLAGASSDFKSSFSGGGSITDVFSIINSSTSWGFFSQEVANEIEPPLPAMQSDEDIQEQVAAWEELSEDDEFLSRFKVSDSGFVVPDLGIFDVSGYLEGLQ